MEDDFDEFKRELIHSSILFEDFDFPATNASLYLRKKPSWNNIWRRPKEVNSAAVFMANESQIRLEIKQGPFNNKSMVSGLSAVVQNTELFRHVVPPSQSFTHLYAGVFRFRFWSFGSWIEVRVDDRLPFNQDTGKFMTLTSVDKREFWVALIEKACAKFYGSYESIELCLIGEIMEDMSGGISESFNLTSFHSQLNEMIFKAYDRQSLITLTIPGDEVAGGHLGLIGGGRSYSVNKVLHVESKPTGTDLLRLHNAWSSNEWRGAWSVNSSMWKSFSAFMKRDLGITFDGERDFFISFEDVVKYFTYLDVCNIPADPRWFDSYGRRHWSYYRFFDHWGQNTAGGGPTSEHFFKNPQYRMILAEPDANSALNCTVRVALLQDCSRDQHDIKHLSIGFSVYHLQQPELYPNRLTKEFFAEQVPLMVTGFFKVRQVMRRLVLQPGSYCVVPSTKNSSRTGHFLMRFLTEKGQVIYPVGEIEVNNEEEALERRRSTRRSRVQRTSQDATSFRRNLLIYIVLSAAIILVAWGIKHFFGDFNAFLKHVTKAPTTPQNPPSPSNDKEPTETPSRAWYFSRSAESSHESKSVNDRGPPKRYNGGWFADKSARMKNELSREAVDKKAETARKEGHRFWWEDLCKIL